MDGSVVQSVICAPKLQKLQLEVLLWFEWLFESLFLCTEIPARTAMTLCRAGKIHQIQAHTDINRHAHAYTFFIYAHTLRCWYTHILKYCIYYVQVYACMCLNVLVCMYVHVFLDWYTPHTCTYLYIVTFLHMVTHWMSLCCRYISRKFESWLLRNCFRSVHQWTIRVTESALGWDSWLQISWHSFLSLSSESCAHHALNFADTARNFMQ